MGKEGQWSADGHPGGRGVAMSLPQTLLRSSLGSGQLARGCLQAVGIEPGTFRLSVIGTQQVSGTAPSQLLCTLIGCEIRTLQDCFPSPD